ncbi:hypothetical protein [Helicobacter sp. T3_23-1059]
MQKILRFIVLVVACGIFANTYYFSDNKLNPQCVDIFIQVQMKTAKK